MTQQPQAAARSVDPVTGAEFARYPFLAPAEVECALRDADRAYRAWSRQPISDRIAVLARLASVLRERRDALALLATREMGKPIAQSRAEVEKCASLCDWCVASGEAILRDEPSAVGPDAWVAWRPTGVVLGVMPWNFPYWQAMRAAAGVLLGGNVFLLKPAPNVVGCAELLRDAWRDAGAPGGAFSLLNTANEEVSLAIRDRRVSGVMVTGSPRAGAAIAAQAGAAIKKTVLELGGSDPFIVLADADVDAAVAAGIAARFANTGQVCIAAKRFLLAAPIAAEFTAKFVAATEKLRIGDPQDEVTYLGPLARRDLRDTLVQQVERTIAAGARVLLRGGALPGDGNFYAPTVVADVSPAMSAFCEETFGPVAALTTVTDADAAIAMANMSDYGLNATLWTGDERRAVELAANLEAGAVFINGITASDPRLPIGGVKNSGYGRELSHLGVREFLNAQTVWKNRS